MAVPRLFRTLALVERCPCPEAGRSLGPSRCLVARLAHLEGMTTHTTNASSETTPFMSGIEPVLSLTELCEHLHVPAQTIYDLRSQGRGPRGFRVGRELRFRIGEIESWLARLEDCDQQHASDPGPGGGR
ncbi:transcriptional regulator, AlpA family [Nocardioides sp. YR527]|nr:transcriptional regulator, AlpA family [Nocardioides sp. YR527]